MLPFAFGLLDQRDTLLPRPKTRLLLFLATKAEEEWTISVWTLAPIDVNDHTYRDLVGRTARQRSKDATCFFVWTKSMGGFPFGSPLRPARKGHNKEENTIKRTPCKAKPPICRVLLLSDI